MHTRIYYHGTYVDRYSVTRRYAHQEKSWSMYLSENSWTLSKNIEWQQSALWPFKTLEAAQQAMVEVAGIESGLKDKEVLTEIRL